MKAHLKGFWTGINFGLTSGVITTLGLMVGLHSGTHSTVAVIGGILTIAVADAMSDAFGVHVSKEAEHDISDHEVWTATISTFVAKFSMAMTFAVPVLLFELLTAIFVSLVWGLIVITLLSFRLARTKNLRPGPIILEHIGITLAVVTAAHFVGVWVARVFG
jgi:vacuolar iron transporter family protein